MMNGAASLNHTLQPRRVRETLNDHLASLGLDLSDSWMEHPSPPHPYATNMHVVVTNLPYSKGKWGKKLLCVFTVPTEHHWRRLVSTPRS